MQDYQNGVGENDLAHLTGCLSLTDKLLLSKFDATAHETGYKNNLTTIVIHHYTFNTALFIRLKHFCGLDVVAVDKYFPESIIILGKLH